VVWATTRGRGRVVYDGFGHDVASLTHPVHRQLLCQAVDWVAGHDRAEVRR
jgi:type 1 glutamine amidotransferase